MEEDESIAALMARLEALIENMIDRKFAERDQKIEARFDEIMAVNKQKAKKRGIAIRRARAKHKPDG